jgi:hypothetical protein
MMLPAYPLVLNIECSVPVGDYTRGRNSFQKLHLEVIHEEKLELVRIEIHIIHDRTIILPVYNNTTSAQQMTISSMGCCACAPVSSPPDSAQTLNALPKDRSSPVKKGNLRERPSLLIIHSS